MTDIRRYLLKQLKRFKLTKRLKKVFFVVTSGSHLFKRDSLYYGLFIIVDLPTQNTLFIFAWLRGKKAYDRNNNKTPVLGHLTCC